MADHAVIPESRTRTPVEWDEILASLDKFDRGLLGPDGKGRAVKALLSAGADAFRGNGKQLNRTVTSLAQMMRVLGQHRSDLTGTIESLDGLTTALAGNDRTIRRFVDSVAGATDLMATERRQFGQTMTALSTLLKALAAFARDHQAELRHGVTGLTTVTRTLLKHQAALIETVEVLPTLAQNLGLAVDDNRRLRVKLPVNDLAPGNQGIDSLCDQLPARLCDQLGTSPSLQQLLDDLVGAR
jgi:virulence factor Mce-like protein